MANDKWIKWPAPGEFRGEGEWKRIADVSVDPDYWAFCRDSGYLPTHEGDQPPTETA